MDLSNNNTCKLLLSGRFIVIAIETVIVCSLFYTVDLARNGIRAKPAKANLL